MTAEEQLIEDYAGYSRDPLACVYYSFPWGEAGDLEEYDGPREWQASVLQAIGEHLQNPDTRFQPCQIAVASGHGIGKSALIAMITHWAKSTCEDARVVVTANTATQLDTKTWPEVSKWFRRSLNAHWWDVQATSITIREKDHKETWRTDAITWSENNTEAFAGLHNKGKRIVVIFDEASAIADRVWEVTEGALTDEETEIIWIAFGNPTQNTGRFRECFGRYKHRWITRQIDSRTVAGTNKAQLDKWIQDYGEDSDFCRVRVRGEFPRAGSTQFISGDVVAAARKRDVGDQSGVYKILSVDVARFGDDQTVIGVRQGLRFSVLEKLRGLDTMQVGARVKYHVEREEPRTCVIDGDGIGAGVFDYVHFHVAEWKSKRPWFRLEEFHGGGKPFDASMYFNARAEVWGLMRAWLETGEIPDDAELDSDLTGPQYFFSAKNAIQLERKEDMKKRGLASPDVGDALAMTFSANVKRETFAEAYASKMEKAYQEGGPNRAHMVSLKMLEKHGPKRKFGRQY